MQNTTTMIDIKRVLNGAPVFASFAVKDVDAAREFYGTKLGMDVRTGRENDDLEIHGPGGRAVFVYAKPDHQPAVFTVLNLQVRDIDEAVDGLTAAGVTMEHYKDENGITTDKKGVARGAMDGGKGPRMAWFRDPSGNIVSVMETAKA